MAAGLAARCRGCTPGTSPAQTVRDRDLAARAQDLLRDVPRLALVPGPWLHLTMQGIGFSDEVSGDDLAAITAAARSRLAAVSPAAVTIGPARVLDGESAATRTRPPR